MTRRFLSAGPPAIGWDCLLGRPLGRRLLFAIERILSPGILLHWLVRKCLLDVLAREAIAAGCRQVVVLGAGLDTLAWRLRAQACCFELDHPATQSSKRLPIAHAPILLPADLSRVTVAEVLKSERSFDFNTPTLFVAEGLLMYLSTAEVTALFRELAALVAPGSRFTFSFMEARPGKPLAFHHASPLIGAWLRWRREPFRWGLARAAADAFAAEQGWRLVSLSSPEELREHFLAPHGLEGRPLALGESVALLHLTTR